MAVKLLRTQGLARVQIIPEKIAVPSDVPRLSRERLLEILRHGLNQFNSTVVSGRAGTGKTTLVAEFARQCERRAAWYKIDASDSDLKIFLHYLCASVRRVRPGFGERFINSLSQIDSEQKSVQSLVEQFVYELLEGDEPLLIVIDDLHLLYDEEWVVQFFSRLLPLLSPEIHITLIGRSLPPAPLWRMRSKQTLGVIDEAALAFTLQETEALFAAYNLPTNEAERAWHETRGRVGNLMKMIETTTNSIQTLNKERRLTLVKGFSACTSFDVG